MSMLYHKIETLFERSTDGNKALIEGKWRNPLVEYLKDNTWTFTEKIDGTNIRIIWDGHKVTFGGRTERAQIPAHLIDKLLELFGGETVAQMFEQLFGEREVVLFGEGYGYKIQKGGLYRPDVSFILFDVAVNGVYQPRIAVEAIADTFAIEVVPVLFEGTLSDGVDFVKTKPVSTIGTHPMEGLVARPQIETQDRHGNRVIVKIKVSDFGEGETK